MEHVELKVKQLDKALTRDWQPVCLGHYSLKLPPQWLPLKKNKLRFDGYKFEIEKAVYAGALSAAFNEKEQELACGVTIGKPLICPSSFILRLHFVAINNASMNGYKLFIELLITKYS